MVSPVIGVILMVAITVILAVTTGEPDSAAEAVSDIITMLP
jgi:flagellin-like protein